MINTQFLSWIYWNPPRDLFVIPYIHHPVRIYGVCFVIGFLLSYFLLAWMFKRKLSQSTDLQERDISSWSLFAKDLQMAIDHSQHPAHPLTLKFSAKVRQELSKLQCHQELSLETKSAILSAMNESTVKLSRSQLESAFPHSIIPAKRWGYVLTDKLTWFVVLGTVIGARLGHVFFYEWPRYQHHLLEIFMVWKGGLASHGGVLGVMLAVFLYYKTVLKPFPELSFIGLLDMLVVPSGLVAGFIRLGNFFNQEILGPPTTKPWGIIFGDPFDDALIVPRHPTQLYEGIIYFSIFFLMLYLWKNWMAQLRTGFLCGLFFVLLFGARFFIEFLKLPQSMMIDESFLQMGQFLSLPFIALGLGLMAYSWRGNSCPLRKQKIQ
jgi:phosphatidylglycerol---prolipoprotein diacylglyceryl transferase